MGNTGSGSSRSRRHRSYQTSQPTQPPQSEITGINLIFGASTPYSSQYPPQYYQYHGYYPPQPVPVPYPQPYRGGGVYPHPGPAHANWVAGQYPCGAGFAQPEPYVEHQKAVTIRNDVNVKKETLQLDPDEENSGSFLVAFTFDATASGRITVMFFAKEEEDSNFIVTKESLLKPVTVNFQQGLGQKFRQPSGTGINFSMFDEIELLKGGNTEVFPVMVKAEVCPANQGEHEPKANSSGNSQITLAVFKKDKGEYQMRVTKQILWVNKMRYELQEIYGIGNAVDGDLDENDSGKECVICLSEPRDTTVLPCRHMCMCSGCAKVLRFQTDRCPICRQPVERLLEIKVNIGPDN